MALLPLSYAWRSLFVRPVSTVLTVVSIGATVAVLGGVLALQQGFDTLFTDHGRDDVAVFLRPGSTSEGDSVFPRDRADVLIKTLPELAEDAEGRVMASREMYLAVRLFKLDGGETNVPIRGVEPMSRVIDADVVHLVDGAWFEPGTDEVIVGESLTHRIQHCRIGQVIQLNTAPLRVVGVFRSDGPYASEIWGDADRLATALERPGFNRVIARLKPGVDLEDLAARLEHHKEAPALVLTEREYFSRQTAALSAVLLVLGAALTVIMGTAAAFTGTNTMLAAVAARTHEIGVLLSLGFRPWTVLVSFLFEALVLGLLGGVVGSLLVLPIHGIRTGTTNFQTFTEVAFAFRITPSLLVTSILVSLVIGLLSGAWPALKASLLRPCEALRRT